MTQCTNSSGSTRSDFQRGGRYPTLSFQRGFGLLAYLLAGIVLAGLIGTGIYKVKQWGANEVRAEWAEANRLAREAEAKKANDASKGLEADREKTKVVYRTITREVDRIVDRPVYRNICLDADGLRLARCAILGASPDTCKPDGALPAPVRPSGGNGGGHLALDYRLGASLSRLR